MKVLGIPIAYDEKQREIAVTKGFFGWSRISIGGDFPRFPAREQQAFLLHEVGHIKLHHAVKRFVFVTLRPLLIYRYVRAFLRVLKSGDEHRVHAELADIADRVPSLKKLCHDQEYQADYFAAQCGYGPDLARAFSRLDSTSERSLHPSVRDRVKRLMEAPNPTGSIDNHAKHGI